MRRFALQAIFWGLFLAAVYPLQGQAPAAEQGSDAR